ncbi:MAG: DNA-processing protein DprA [Paramuribaculum sp.]|nr:DNA-processing protein DprA [Paramuribaculum sp.]
MTTHTNQEYHIAFASLRGINHALADELLERSGSEQKFFESSRRELITAMGFDSKIFDDSYRASLLEKAVKENTFITDNGVRALYYKDPAYPQRLLECDDAPLMLFTIGDMDLNAHRFISIVGTRHASAYGINFVDRLVKEIAERVDGGATIVSGLAYGIDISAHAAALKYGLPTAAVLAHGLTTIYPAQHRSIAADMARHGGMLITDYHSDAPIHRANFLARNRIVAGLCDCLVVAESAEKGGAMTTARIASAYNRDVFALPGRTSDTYSAGCNRLIADNIAGLIQNADDLIKAMNYPTVKKPEQPSLFIELTDDERAVTEFLTAHGDAQINQLTIHLNQSVARVISLLIDMEYKGLILSYPGGKYALA